MDRAVSNIKWLMLVGLILSSILGPLLPPQWGWENGPLEWLQVVVLSVGLVLSALWAYQARSDNDAAGYRMWFWSLPAWVLIIGRELSWGRVFFLAGMNESGPILLRLSDLRFGYLVHPTLALIVVVWLIAGYKHNIYRDIYKLLTRPGFPFNDVIMTLVACIIGRIGEKIFHRPVIEELAENIAYIGLIVIAAQVRRLLNSQQWNSADNSLRIK